MHAWLPPTFLPPTFLPPTFLPPTFLPPTFAVNSLDRSMGQPDLYPFVLSAAVVAKPGPIHRLVHRTLPAAGTGAIRAPLSAPLEAGVRRLRAITFGVPMANYTTIEAEVRTLAGKGAARATRRAGRVPAVIYGAKQVPTMISLEPKLVVREIQRSGWRSRLFEIKAGDGPATRALIRDVQFHPVTDRPEHVDFQRLAPGERIRVAIAVVFQNELVSPGLKRGGILNVVRASVECLCDPDNVPAHFDADLAALEINDNVRWSDLKGTEGIRPTVTDRDFVIATVAPSAKGAEQVAADAAAAAAATAPKSKAPKQAAKPAAAAAAAPAKAAAKPAAKK